MKLGTLSGSLTKLTDGTSYLVAGSGISIITGSTGAVTITNNGTVGDITAVNAGTGLSGGGDSGAVTLNINDSVIATVSGTTFTGVTKHNAGLSGSLTKLTDGTSYLVAGNNVTINSASNGAITISSTGGSISVTYFDSTTNGSIFTTGSVALRGPESFVDSPIDKGTNVFFYVSGSINGAGGNDKRTLFGGDVVMSGSLMQGLTTTAAGLSSHAEGLNTLANREYSHAEGRGAATGGIASHAEGYNTVANGDYSHAEGEQTTASGLGSHAEGYGTTASNNYSHAEGSQTTASGELSHAEGDSTTAAGTYSHAEGTNATSTGDYSHAEGDGTKAAGNASHAEGYQTISAYYASHAEGYLTIASASYSHTEGAGTIASGTYQHVSGKYNKRGNNFSLFVVGDGTNDSDASRSDILRVNSGSTIGTGRVEVTGSFAATLGVSGSLTKLTDGTSYLIAGNYVTITTGSNGAITIDGTASGAPTDAQYLVLTANAGLGNERVFTTGTGLAATDGGANGDYTLAINNAVVATVSGTTFTGAISSPGITSTAGLTQSGGNVSLAAQTNGSVSIGNDSGTTTTSILGGTSIILSGAAGTNYTLGGETGTGTITIGQSTQSNTINIGNGAVTSAARIQTINIGANASSFGSAVVSVGSIAGLSNTTIAAGSTLTLTGSTGTSYIIGGQGQTGTMTVGRSTASNTINIGSAGNNVSNTQTINVGSGTGTSAVTIGSTAGTSPTIIQAGTTGLSVSGSARFNQGLSGSHTKLTDGTSYLIAGSNVTITTGSNGGVTISSTGGSPGGSDKFVQFNDGGSFSGVSTLQFDKTTNQLTAYQASMTNALTASTLKAGASTISLFNDTATTINFAGAATTILAGGSSVTLGLGGVGATNSTITASTGSFGRVLASSTSVFTGATTHNGGITTTTLTATSNATVAGTFSSTGDITGQGTSNQLNALSVTGSLGLSVTGPETVTGVLTAQSSSNLGTIIELMSSSNGGTGVVNFSISSSSIFYVNNPAGNITANFTGVPTTTERIISTTVILSQSSTGRIVSAVQIDGASSTINWSNGITPTGNAGKQDVFGFSLIRSGSAWKTLGQMSTFG